MSKSIQIRGVPEEVHAVLRMRAAAAGQSLSEYLLHEAIRIAARPSLGDVLDWASEREWGVAPGIATGATREIRDEASTA